MGLRQLGIPYTGSDGVVPYDLFNSRGICWPFASHTEMKERS